MSIHSLKKLFARFGSTPLHPQWLLLRDRARAHSIALLAHGEVLDIGCGDRWIEPLLDRNARYVGLDYLPTVELGYAGRPDTFGDAHCLPFGNDRFDTVLLLDILEHLRRPDVALREVRRVLKTGGTVLVQVPFLYPLHDEPYDFQRWTRHGLDALFAQHGIAVKEIGWQGHPAETGAALLAIALARSVLDSMRQRHFSLMLAPALLLAIPFVNLTGWLLSHFFPAAAFMPMGYRVIGVKLE